MEPIAWGIDVAVSGPHSVFYPYRARGNNREPAIRYIHWSDTNSGDRWDMKQKMELV